MSWTVYLLKCADGTLYCGCTNNLTKRLAAHNRGQGAKYTRSRLPVALAYREETADRSAALWRGRRSSPTEVPPCAGRPRSKNSAGRKSWP